MYIDLGIKIRNAIITRYPALDKSDIPAGREVTQIDYRNGDIEQFEAIFWHRLLKRLYQGPLEIECELHRRRDKDQVDTETVTLRKTQEGNRWEVLGKDDAFASKIQRGQIKLRPVNWKYLIRLPSGGIVELGTRDKTTVFYVAQVTRSHGTQQKDTGETKAFIDRILAEANRLRNELFSPKREFEKREGLKLYFLFNIYRANYLSALTMLRIAKSQDPGGHLKLPHLWPGQTPPPRLAGRGGARRGTRGGTSCRRGPGCPRDRAAAPRPPAACARRCRAHSACRRLHRHRVRARGGGLRAGGARRPGGQARARFSRQPGSAWPMIEDRYRDRTN